MEYGNCHGSHIIPVSADHRLALNPINIKTLCYHDHMNWWHKNPLEAAEWFEKKFPERREWLREQKIIDSGLGTISIVWIQEWKEQLQKLIKLTPDEIEKWQKDIIDEKIHDWI